MQPLAENVAPELCFGRSDERVENKTHKMRPLWTGI
jgi:hypothetical protein